MANNMKTKPTNTMRASINWGARIAAEQAADVKIKLRTKPSERKQYKSREQDVNHITERPAWHHRTLGDGNSERLAPPLAN